MPSSIFLARESFNSRSREGSDHNGREIPSYDVSFNSRSREGSDHTRFGVSQICSVFQFTLP